MYAFVSHFAVKCARGGVSGGGANGCCEEAVCTVATSAGRDRALGAGVGNRGATLSPLTDGQPSLLTTACNTPDASPRGFFLPEVQGGPRPSDSGRLSQARWQRGAARSRRAALAPGAIAQPSESRFRGIWDRCAPCTVLCAVCALVWLATHAINCWMSAGWGT